MKIQYISIMTHGGTKYVVCNNNPNGTYAKLLLKLDDISINQIWNILGLNQSQGDQNSIFNILNVTLDNAFGLNNDLKYLDFTTLSVETMQLDLTKPNITIEQTSNIYSEFHLYKVHTIIKQKLTDADVVFLDLLETLMIQKLSEDQNTQKDDNPPVLAPNPYHISNPLSSNTIPKYPTMDKEYPFSSTDWLRQRLSRIEGNSVNEILNFDRSDLTWKKSGENLL